MKEIEAGPQANQCELDERNAVGWLESASAEEHSRANQGN
jgi:hypothetical protein